MELFSAAFFVSLINIIFIDLILAGDNAIVIGMAARRLPQKVQKKAILYGTGGAVLLRIVATLVVVWLLNIPWLLAVGGALLIFISYKVLTDDGDHDSIKAESSLWPAVRTIVIADAAMGLDNVIAVAGASGQHMILVVIGLLISVPIVVWGSTLFIKLLNSFPWIAYVGAAVLAYTAAHMITTEPKLVSLFGDKPMVRITFIIIIVAGVLLLGHLKKKQNQRSGGKKTHSDPATHS
ncbi:Integral membrane protein TerC family protein [compost metagenome]